MSEYIKIADFASRKGISKQEAYKIANDPQNKDYVIFEDGIKKISSFLLDDKPIARSLLSSRICHERYGRIHHGLFDI